MTRPVELLAPAKNLECGMAAVSHGADAVYIGAPHFGARQMAGNSLEDIAALCAYAHQFGARVYVTVNTILYDSELEDARKLLEGLVRIGVDAILVQDMAVVAMLEDMRRTMPGGTLFPALHASTQTDNRTADKVGWLSRRGFSRVVLAREVSLDEISAIHEAQPSTELEVFVHGALCVSYSGACYASHYCFGRSANRGECAQFCRMKFDLVDAAGHTVERGRHLLSLRDMCRIDSLESLMEAGVVSFKIEGRLKDVSYVKNVVAAYSLRLNEIIAKSGGRYRRASAGRVSYTFQPSLQKTFNRGFTDYFLYGRKPDITSFDTPKAIGECVGRVKEVRRDSFNVAGVASFANGDGLCFVNAEHELEGFRVNRAAGNRLFPQRMPAGLRPGTVLYRNRDQEFERTLSKDTAVRKMALQMALSKTDNGLRLEGRDELGRTASVEWESEHQQAQRPQAENMRSQLTKLGNTPYEASHVDIADDVLPLFIPSSLLANMRRELVEKLLAAPLSPLSGPTAQPATEAEDAPADISTLNLANVSNALARRFYDRLGLAGVPEAYETLSRSTSRGTETDLPLMTCRHCLRYSLGRCDKRGGRKPEWKESLTLVLADGRRFRLQFDCKHCQMKVYAQNR